MQADELTGLSGKTILITGAGGMLGRAFIDSLANVGDVNVQGRDHAQLDITDRPSVLELAMLNPDIIIHCAADVNAERCEAQPDQCRKVQVDGT